MPFELIEFLLTYCAENGREDRRYVGKVAQNWVSEGVKTVHDARVLLELFSVDYREVMRAFGKMSDSPNKSQADYIKKWRLDWKIGLPDIVSACEKAYENTGKMGFAYADKILAKQDKSQGGETPLSSPAKPPPDIKKGRNKFANFSESADIDFDELERKERELLLKRFGG
jgi:DNA replication protein DnaD